MASQVQAGGIASRLREGLGVADIEVVALPGPPAHPADEPRENLEPEVERPQGSDLTVGVCRDNVDSRIGQVAPRLARLFDERDNAPHVIQLGDPAGPGIGSAEQEHRERIAVRAVEREQSAEVDVAEVVGVDDDDLVGAVGQIGVGGDRAGRAEQIGLERLGKVEAFFGVDTLDVGPNLIGVRVRVDPCLGDAGVAQAVDPVSEERTPRDRHQALGDRIREGPQPSPQTCRQDHRLGVTGHDAHLSCRVRSMT